MLTPVPGSRPSLQARLVAVALADHAGSALDTAATARRERRQRAILRSLIGVSKESHCDGGMMLGDVTMVLDMTSL